MKNHPLQSTFLVGRARRARRIGEKASNLVESLFSLQPHGALGERALPFGTVFACLLLILPLATHAQIELVPDETPEVVFAGKAQTIHVTFHNRGGQKSETEIRTRLFQASSSSLAPVGEVQGWKKLEILAGQTVLENFEVNCPEVKTILRFQLQWTDDKDGRLGKTDLIACPADALKTLKTLGGDKPIGIWDPSGKMKPLLEALKVEVEDLTAGTSFDAFHGKLAILGPFPTKDTMPSGFRENVKKLAERGVGVVWIQPFSDAALSASATRMGAGVLVLARPAMISDLAETPLSQLRLLELARIATSPDTILSDPSK